MHAKGQSLPARDGGRVDGVGLVEPLRIGGGRRESMFAPERLASATHFHTDTCRPGSPRRAPARRRSFQAGAGRGEAHGPINIRPRVVSLKPDADPVRPERRARDRLVFGRELAEDRVDHAPVHGHSRIIFLQGHEEDEVAFGVRRLEVGPSLKYALEHVPLVGLRRRDLFFITRHI